MEGYATPKLAAKYLGLNDPRVIYSLIKKGIPCRKLNDRVVLVKYSELDSFLDQYKQPKEATTMIPEQDSAPVDDARVMRDETAHRNTDQIVREWRGGRHGR